MYSYFAYGLVIHSVLEMAGLEPCGDETPDLSIVYEALPHCVPPLPCSNYRLEGEPKWFSWTDVGRFELRANSVLAVDPNPGVTVRYLAFAILGPIIAYILHTRGNLVLHANAVGVDGACIAFMAEKGVGKSTTAAMCLAAGYTPVCDDVTSLRIDLTSDAWCAPGFPMVKLKHDAAAHFTIPNSVPLPEPMANFPKSQLFLKSQFSRKPQRIERVYVLKRGQAAKLHRLDEIDALTKLTANAYISLYARRKAYVSNGEKRRLFEQCTTLAKYVPVSELEIPDGLDVMTNALALIAQDWQPAHK